MKILAHYIFFENKLYNNSIVEIVNNEVKISEFTNEIANTEFFNGLILVSKKDYSDLEGLFKSFMKGSGNISAAVNRLVETIGKDEDIGYYHLTKLSF